MALGVWNGGTQEEAVKYAKLDRAYIVKRQRCGNYGVWDNKSDSWVEFSWFYRSPIED